MIEDLDRLYLKYNKVEFVHPDPFEFVLKYSNKHDQEVVGLIAASFAVGNVYQILKFLDSVFIKMGESPYEYLLNIDPLNIELDFKGFYYRYYKDNHIVEFFQNISRVLKKFKSIENWVTSYDDSDFETYYPLFKKLSADFNLSSALIPKSEGNSAFKRLALFFRWMVRDDGLDLGLWKSLSPSKLIIPLDIHMTHISKILGFTNTGTNSMANVLKITNEFRKLNMDDPVKWDFSLSRLGIHPDLNYEELINLFKIS